VSTLIDEIGAHTIGFSRCRQFSFRLTDGDQFLTPSLAQRIESQCPQANSNNVLPFDPSSPFLFDTSYFQNLQSVNGLLFSDQVLFSHPATKDFVSQFASSQALFFQSFIDSIAKLASIGVLTGEDGEIRSICSQINPA
jgi:peroxidase